MASFKDKLQVFFLGLLLGLILGGGFFLFKLDQYVKELSIYKSFTRSTEPYAIKTEHRDEREMDEAHAKNRPVPMPVYTSQATLKKDSLAHPSNNISQTSLDSLKSDSLRLFSSSGNDDIVLRKDELISSRNVEEININPVAANPAASHDSLAAKMAGVRDDHPGSRQFSSVEFWSSPLNYKGYKMNRNKLILYGLGEPEGARLFKLDDELYLQTGFAVYRLEYTNDFKPYERVVSEGILSRLK